MSDPITYKHEKKPLIVLTFIKVMFTRLKALPQGVWCYENAFCFQKVA